jgi:flagellar motor switch protein FliN/FliY
LEEQAQADKVKAPSTDETAATAPSEFDRFRDLPMQAAVHLDRRRLLVRELLSLERESVIRLERSGGENVDLMLNGTLIASGEIVVIDEMVGLRITDIRQEGPQ